MEIARDTCLFHGMSALFVWVAEVGVGYVAARRKKNGSGSHCKRGQERGKGSWCGIRVGVRALLESGGGGSHCGGVVTMPQGKKENQETGHSLCAWRTEKIIMV